ncbi:MAG: hypothetical protein RL585_1098 [Pseudomonadota bacterium]
MQAKPLEPTPIRLAVDKAVGSGHFKASTSSGHVCMTREQIACLAPSVKTYASLYPPNRGFIQAL